jgi:thioesterase domain-containing protein/enoyl-CoA hydratase/carnithine racemase
MNSKDILQALQGGAMSAEDAEKKLRRIMDERLPAEVEPPLFSEVPQGSSFTLPAEWKKYAQQEQGTVSSVVTISEPATGIVQVTMEDKAHKNTFSVDLIIGLMQAFHTIQEKRSYKVVILTGYENYFACGGSQEGLTALYEGKVKMTDVNIYSLPLQCEIPVIAAMQGHAIGGGWCFGLFSDFFVMSRESSYTCNHMKYGFTPGDGATLVFPEKFGYSLAQEILFTGRKYRGAELESRGLGIPIVPRKEVLAYAVELAKELAEVPRSSLVLLKAHMTEAIKKRLSGTLEKEWQMQEQTFINKPDVMQKMLSAFNQVPKEREKGNGSESSHNQARESVSQRDESIRARFSELIYLNRREQGQPVFWFHGEGGGVEGYQSIAQTCSRPFYGLQARGRMSAEAPIYGIKAMASYYIQLIQATQPKGPYDLGGYSLGGILAYETARQLQETGQRVRSIVMVDSMDGASLKKATISNHGLILQTVNLSLMNRIRRGAEQWLQKLIHQREVDENMSEEEYLRRLISIGTTRGLSQRKTETELFAIFRKNIQVQQAFEADQFEILPLPDAQNVTCLYFRNQKGEYYGELWPYLTGTIDQNRLDNLSYWEEWRTQFPHLQIIDVDATSHITLLFEQNPQETISSVCEHLYQLREEMTN